MKRRNFLHILPSIGITPFVLNGFAVRPFANSRMAKILSSCDEISERVLVLIQLKGGNDGLNNFVPVNQYDTYAKLRPTVRISDKAFINLDTTLPQADQIGLHPSLAPFKTMYEKGWACFIQGVGYQDMNQSHFQGTNIWLTGGDTTGPNMNQTTGWMGRSLQALFPDVKGTPTADMPDPLGIQLGDPNPSLGFHTEEEHQVSLNLSGQDASGFYTLIQTIGGAPIVNVPNTEHGEELDYIMATEKSVNDYAERISKVFDAGVNSTVEYPTPLNTNITLPDQLRTVARLIQGGSKTKIFLCQLGGFDTHKGQVDEVDTTSGDHGQLLDILARSTEAFFADLEALGLADRVIGCTFSEFGRCAAENGSFGTDHGTLAPMFLFGKHIKPGVTGTNVNLSDLTKDNQLKGVQTDYRQAFATLLQDWLGASGGVLEETMFTGFNKLSVLDPAAVAQPDCYLPATTTSIWGVDKQPRAMSIFPNPARVTTEISYNAQTSFMARITLHAMNGSLISARNVQVQAGENLFYFDVSDLPAGIYVVRFENTRSGSAEVGRFTVAR